MQNSLIFFFHIYFSLQKMPRYVAPNARPDERIEQVNSARGRNQYRHLIVVGNTSKYIGDEERDSATNVTHKWLVYIATKAAVPIDKIVSKVRFFLHESYRPNDIVEVLSAPFQIAKRGWGEFPLRVQLYFHPHLHQKPIQILHNLVLDKKHSGLQTMGMCFGRCVDMNRLNIFFFFYILQEPKLLSSFG